MYTTPETDQEILAATETDAADSTNAATSHPPTHEERLALVHALQNEALKQPDLMRANLEIISGDLMLIAYGTHQALLARVPRASSGFKDDERFMRLLEPHLRCLRQIDHIAQVIRRTPKGSKPAAEVQ